MKNYVFKIKNMVWTIVGREIPQCLRRPVLLAYVSEASHFSPLPFLTSISHILEWLAQQCFQPDDVIGVAICQVS